jgi:hypothetical protein
MTRSSQRVSCVTSPPASADSGALINRTVGFAAGYRSAMSLAEPRNDVPVYSSINRDRQRVRDGTQQQEAAMAGQDGDPRHHTQKMAQRLQETITHLREDVKKVDEPQLKAMFETSAEVLGGLVKAFKDYEQKNEAAWRK